MKPAMIFGIATLGLCSGITQAASCNLEKLQWLNGHWLLESEKSKISESWQRVSDNTMEGIGFTQKKGSDTRQYESMRIVQMSGELFFLAKVSHNPLPIAFVASECSEHSVQFVNKNHDFPNLLHYQLLNQQLQVEVKGNDGKGFKLTFDN